MCDPLLPNLHEFNENESIPGKQMEISVFS